MDGRVDILITIEDGNQLWGERSVQSTHVSNKRTHPRKITLSNERHDDQGVEAYQISGETKLNTWKLRNLVCSAVPPVELNPMTRRTNAVMKSASVRRLTKFQNEKERQVAKRNSL